ncbi:MAG TPA: sulfatase-like hydrolase/transferase [Vicinamibacterales bacterium]|nr:sulfatase-like hydrolase/transferase [Vicinamibacterales bacterium]
MPATRSAQLIGWFAALLGPTLYVKYRVMTALARAWVAGASVAQVGDGEMPSPWKLWWLHVAPTDVIEVAIGVALVWLIGHVILRVRIAWLATVTVALAMLYLGATLIALRETGTLATVEALRLALRWVWHEPGVLLHAFTPRHYAMMAAGLLWVASPIALAHVIARLERGAAWRRWTPAALATALVVAAAIARPDVFAPASPSISVSRGLWTSAALTLTREWRDAPRVPTQSAQALLDEYWRLVYPKGRPPQAAPRVDLAAAERRPRHVIVVMLETAPRQFYDLIDNPSLPVLQSMAAHAIVSNRHYAAAPTSDLGVHAIFSGTYPRPGHPIYRFGRFTTDGLATTLRARGYQTTFIDSTTLRWNVAQEADAVLDLGFSTVREMSDVPLPPIDDPYEYSVARDRKSLSLALDAVVEAARHDQRALVAVQTNLGHYPWRAPAGTTDQSPRARIAGLARTIDGLLGELRAGLASHHLEDEAIIIVTGDHGLRFALEFDSVGEPIRHGDLMFNVPLVIYAPSLIKERITLSWVTSHVDLAPTILDLLGVPRDGLLLQGESVLDRRLEDRVTLLPSGMFVPMYPVDGFHYLGNVYAWAYVIDRVNVRADPVGVPGAAQPALTSDQVRALLTASRRLLDDTAAFFLHRSATAAASPGVSR